MMCGCRSCTIDFSPLMEDIPVVGGRHDTKMAEYRVRRRARWKIWSFAISYAPDGEDYRYEQTVQRDGGHDWSLRVQEQTSLIVIIYTARKVHHHHRSPMLSKIWHGTDAESG
jgi:hypothetical protein